MRARRLALAVALAAVALALGRVAALAIDVPATPFPLPGSQFQGGDGDQLNAPGLIDWQGLQADGRVEHSSDPNLNDNVFAGGAKEDEPDRWGLTTENGGSNPASGNVLDTYRAVDRNAQGDLFLYLAFTREASDGTVFATFELNQDDRLWTNAAGERIACRTTGDILIEFEPHGSGQTVQVERWVTDTRAANGCAKTGHLLDAGNLRPNVDVQGAFNTGELPIADFLPGSYGVSIPTLRFGEAAINLTEVLGHSFGDECAVFASTWMHTRSSSSSESSALKDYVAPARFFAPTCKANPALSSSTGGTLGRAGTRHRLRRHREINAPLSDTAHLTGGASPTGTLTFRLYGPDDADCSSAPIFISTVAVDGNGYYGSGSFTPTDAGTYRWVVVYSGDRDNEPAGPTHCGTDTETVTVSPAEPSLATAASGRIIRRARVKHRLRRRSLAPNALWDSATLAGGQAPTGTITFRLYGPADADCSGSPAFTSRVPVHGNGIYLSDTFSPSSAGVYRWVATYSGDRNNDAPPPTGCGEDRETVVVSPASPTAATLPSPGVTVGQGSIFDTATLDGAAHPTGTIEFALHGPGDSDCKGTPVFKSTVSAAGGGPYESDHFTPTDPGVYRWVVTYSGDHDNRPAGPTGCDEERVIVASAPRQRPTISTTASPSAGAGSAVSDTAVLGGGDNPTGEITFVLYGPDDQDCSGNPAFIGTTTVTGNGTYTSPSFVVRQVGTYQWLAQYGGDDRNAPATSNCGESGESVRLTPGDPSFTTAASGAIILGGTVHDTATLSGGSGMPTGTITFEVFGPDDADCSGTPAFTTEVTVTQNGAYVSPGYEPVAAGTYRWVASYSGDDNNAPAISGCNAAGEEVVVSPGRTRLRTATGGVRHPARAAKPRAVGQSITDTAFLGGRVTPTGEITFRLYGPGDTTCSGAPLFITATTVMGSGVYNSQPYEPTVSGIYRWTATYSGDANNRPSGPTSCADAREQSPVTLPATPALTTSASDTVALGGGIADTAHLSGGSNPGGTITFRAYGPDDDDCSGNPVFASTVAVAGNDDYQSAPFTPSVVGRYRWRATYSGDQSNHDAGPTPCADAAELVVVIPPNIVPSNPVLTTTASRPDGVGMPVGDVAHLSGGLDPSGAVTFEFYGPGDATCSGAPSFTSIVAVTGNGDYVSDSFVPADPGIYRWVARYGGDANNTGAGPTGCGDASETIDVPAEPSGSPSRDRNALPARVVKPRRKSARRHARRQGPRFTG